MNNGNTPEEVKKIANSTTEISAVPTSENSKRKTDSSQLPAGQDSPAPVGNMSC